MAIKKVANKINESRSPSPVHEYSTMDKIVTSATNTAVYSKNSLKGTLLTKKPMRMAKRIKIRIWISCNNLHLLLKSRQANKL